MESITRNVRDMDIRERQALEHVLGQQLKENQKIIIQVVTVQSEPAENELAEHSPGTLLPEWCNVFAGLSDKQIVDVEEVNKPLQLYTEGNVKGSITILSLEARDSAAG